MRNDLADPQCSAMLERAWRTSLLWPFLCSATWCLAWAQTPTRSSVGSILLRTTTLPAGEDVKNYTATPTRNFTDVTCVSLLPPRQGSFTVEKGTGVSMGTVLAFWCHEGFQLVGSERISCVLQTGAAHWSNNLPVCEAIPKPEDRGLRVAVLASVVSGIVILAMSVSFIICCLQEYAKKDSDEYMNIRRRDNGQSCNRSRFWMKKEEEDWDAFPPQWIYHQPQHMEPRSTLNKPLYTCGLTGYENRSYQRSQESLQSVPLPGLYCTQSLVYPHVVVQRVPISTAPTVPSAPVYLHLSTPPFTNSLPAQPVLPPYPKTRHSSPHSTPQGPWP